ncbi:MAG: peptidase and chymotrypsin/Hap [Anaerocolumna sp.]|nr:peptidase and chymotrypsin/Hap [Anaerocolumna sp.]
MNNDFNNQNTFENKEDIIDGNANIIDVVEKKNKHKGLRNFTKLVAGSLVFGAIAGASFQGYTYLTKDNQKPTNSIEQNIDETDTIDSENNLSNTELEDGVVAVETSQGNVTSDVSSVVENVMPSIVAINSVVTNVSSDFFGREYSEDVAGSGSGIIIGQNDTEILIATNNHVIANAKSVEIVFADNTKATAMVKGAAANSDLAVVSVNINDLSDDTISQIKIATLGDSNSLKLGEMAIAIGNALGYGQSITVGYVSALDREVTIDGITLKVLQTDAAINPGNSGGALLNAKGEVIGINSVKYVDDSVESIGYAIPISDAIPIINQLMNRTTLAENEKAYLGIKGKDVTDAYAQGFGMPIGVYVGDISKGSPAEKAGIVVGDIIVSINDIAIETMADLQEVLSYTKAGTTGNVVVKSLTDGQYVEKTINVTFGSVPAK